MVREKAPLRRAIESSEVGDAAAFLLSDAARGITGEVMMVDAGYHVVGYVTGLEALMAWGLG